MNPYAIVGFAGPAGAGKDTAGAYLIEEYGFTKLSFAGPLKAMLAAMGYPEPATQDEKEKIIPELGVSWRHAAQTLGTEWGRTCIGPDLWVVLAEKRVRETGGRFVITDLRFENEAKMVRSMSGVIGRLSGRGHKMDKKTAKHVSEAGLAPNQHDIEVNNSGSLEKLYAQIDDMVRYVGATKVKR